MMKLADFQIKAIAKLTESMNDEKKEIVLKSPTGSGKTIIITRFMDEYGKGHFNNVFVWLTPGKGNLEEQSKAKMDAYIHNSSTKLLSNVMTYGFKENDACFINWEKLTKKGNTALRESERTNFLEHIERAHREGLEFTIIIDESHQNDTVRASDLIELFKPKKIIRTSATPSNYTNATLIEVSESDVIAEGLIKKMLIINENFGGNLEIESPLNFLLDKALDKLEELKSGYAERRAIINPLMIVQLPNNNDALLDEIERYLATKHITYENGLLAVWLSDKKQNLEEIEALDAKPIIVIIKQAIATGWDCPRAQILVKLRENTRETFEIQTIGRIRRMPEVKHYENDLLDSCYLYTFDERFTEGVKLNLGKGALDATKLFLKKELRNITLITEHKTEVGAPRDASLSLKTMESYFKNEYELTKKTIHNKNRMEAKGYKFSENIIKQTFTGEVHTLTVEEFENLEKINLVEPLNTHRHGREYHNRVSTLGVQLSLPYEQMNTIIRRLFDTNVDYKNKLLNLETKEVYAFVINNFYRLKEDFRSAMSGVNIQVALELKDITEREITIPKEFLFTFDGNNRVQREYESSVYNGYLSSAEIRSDSEKTFEKYCNDSTEVEWVYRNGDKGNDYLSIVYQDNFGKQKSFYPDYILSKNGEIWIIETKGGFSRSGSSEDIDRYSPKKFEVLKRYLTKHNLKGGFVRKDKSNNELFICTENYKDDIQDECWTVLSEIL